MKAGGGRALRESEGYEPVLRAPFKQGGRKKRNGKTLCYGGHRARGGGFRRQATPRARPLDASAVNLEPRREFLRLTGRVPSRQTWDEASHAACGRCGVRASGDPREARGRGDPPAAPRSPGSARFVVPAARTTKTLAALPAPVPCPLRDSRHPSHDPSSGSSEPWSVSHSPGSRATRVRRERRLCPGRARRVLRVKPAPAPL